MVFILYRDPQIILREKVQYRLGFLPSNHRWASGVCDSCERPQSDMFVHSCICLRKGSQISSDFQGPVTQQITYQVGADGCWEGELDEGGWTTPGG